MTSQDETVAREILASARSLVQRHALEVALKTYWSLEAPGVEECSARAQLLCLGTYLRDDGVARRAHQAWTALSRAAHFHPYELPPTREELLAWQEVVLELLDATERAWRKGQVAGRWRCILSAGGFKQTQEQGAHDEITSHTDDFVARLPRGRRMH